MSVITENCSTLKAYIDTPSETVDPSDQLRSILKEDEVNKRLASDEDTVKKSRESNLIIYGMSEDIELQDCSKELISIADELQLQLDVNAGSAQKHVVSISVASEAHK